jgi:hypothetical protein
VCRMQSELERVSAEIEEATRCMGDGLDELAADHLAAASTLLEELVQSGTTSEPASKGKSLRRIAVA